MVGGNFHWKQLRQINLGARRKHWPKGEYIRKYFSLELYQKILPLEFYQEIPFLLIVSENIFPWNCITKYHLLGLYHLILPLGILSGNTIPFNCFRKYYPLELYQEIPFLGIVPENTSLGISSGNSIRKYHLLGLYQ